MHSFLCTAKPMIQNVLPFSCTYSVAENYVMTAAHCVASANTNWKVVLGEHDISTTTETSFTQIVSVYEIIIHSQYNTVSGENDIALLRTGPIAMNENVGIVCLPWTLRPELFPANTVTAAGWGTLEFGGPVSKILQKVDLQTIGNTECATVHPNLKSSMICTSTAAGQKDTCQGDSGGSLFYTKPANSLLYSIGVVSQGEGCALNKPSINTRVTSYLDWILSKATGAYFCAV